MSYTINNTAKEVTIIVHGRGSVTLPLSVTDSDDIEQDISASTYYFEIKEAGIRELMIANPDNSNQKLVQLDRANIEALKDGKNRFAIIDETDADYPVVHADGFVLRDGYTGSPS